MWFLFIVIVKNVIQQNVNVFHTILIELQYVHTMYKILVLLVFFVFWVVCFYEIVHSTPSSELKHPAPYSNFVSIKIVFY